MQSALVAGRLKVFESDGFFCASFVAPGYPILAARDDAFDELAEWLVDVGVEEDILYGNLPIDAAISLPHSVVMPSAHIAERRFGREAAYLTSTTAFHPPN